MEEDIKILEEFLDLARTRDYKGNLTGSFDEFELEVEEKEYKAIENLLTRYKQLEEENTQLKTITQEYNSYLQDSNCDTKIIIADSEYFANGFFKENFIPKSKVKEKIEELKEDEEFYREHDRMYEFESKIKLLQELLED